MKRAPRWRRSLVREPERLLPAAGRERPSMTTPTQTMDVRRVSPAASIVDVRGDITAGSEPALMDAYTRASGGMTRAVLLNFAALEYMNSGGIGLLVTLLVR